MTVLDEKFGNASSEEEKVILKRERDKLMSRIITHTHLASYKPYTLGELRSGYLYKSDDRIEVFGAKGKTTFCLPPSLGSLLGRESRPWDLL